MLMTQHAHGLYQKSGFTALKNASLVMEIAKPGIYLQQSADETPGSRYDNKQL